MEINNQIMATLLLVIKNNGDIYNLLSKGILIEQIPSLIKTAINEELLTHKDEMLYVTTKGNEYIKANYKQA